MQDYFENILKRHDTVDDNPSTRICGKKIENRITFKIRVGYYLEVLTPETVKLLGSIKKKITKGQNGKIYLM